MCFLIVLHEFFHLLGFRLFAHVPWKRMVVGVNLKLGIAYATTDQLMSNAAIRKALLLPFWMTGIVPALVGLHFGSGVVIVLSALLIGGAVGDFAMYKELKKLPDDWLIKDDPKLPRLYVYQPDRMKKAVHSYQLITGKWTAFFIYTLKRNKMTSPSLTTYSLPS